MCFFLKHTKNFPSRHCASPSSATISSFNHCHLHSYPTSLSSLGPFGNGSVSFTFTLSLLFHHYQRQVSSPLTPPPMYAPTLRKIHRFLYHCDNLTFRAAFVHSLASFLQGLQILYLIGGHQHLDVR